MPLGRRDMQQLVGSVKLRTPQGRRALKALSTELAHLSSLSAGSVSAAAGQPDASCVKPFGSVVRRELRALRRQLGERDVRSPSQGRGGLDVEDASMLVLRQRMRKVRKASHVRAAAELMHLCICDGFWRLGLPLAPAVVDRVEDASSTGEVVQLGEAPHPRLAVSLHTPEALELVRDHLRNTLGQWEHLSRDLPVHLALFQLRETYVTSALFGFRLRRASMRLDLERVAAASSAGDDAKAPSPVSVEGVRALEGNKGTLPTLKAYMALLSFQEESSDATASPVFEAHLALERQAIALFGDASDTSLQSMAARLAVSDLRRLALEAVAFGSLLFDAERSVDAIYELGANDEGLSLQELAADDDAADDEWVLSGRLSGSASAPLGASEAEAHDPGAGAAGAGKRTGSGLGTEGNIRK